MDFHKWLKLVEYNTTFNAKTICLDGALSKKYRHWFAEQDRLINTLPEFGADDIFLKTGDCDDYLKVTHLSPAEMDKLLEFLLNHDFNPGKVFRDPTMKHDLMHVKYNWSDMQ